MGKIKSMKWTCNHINMKQALSHNVVLNTPHLEWDSNSQL